MYLRIIFITMIILNIDHLFMEVFAWRHILCLLDLYYWWRVRRRLQWLPSWCAGLRRTCEVESPSFCNHTADPRKVNRRVILGVPCTGFTSARLLVATLEERTSHWLAPRLISFGIDARRRKKARGTLQYIVIMQSWAILCIWARISL